MNKKIKDVKTFDELLDVKYGKVGTPERTEYEQGFEVFKLGVMMQEMRKEKQLTQEQLAEKCGTTKTNISKIENNTLDIRRGTLMQIVQKGLGGQLKFSVSK